MRNIGNISVKKIFSFAAYPLLFVLFTMMIGHSLNTIWIQALFPNGSILVFISSVVACVLLRKKETSPIENKISFFSIILILVVLFYALVNGDKAEIISIFYVGFSLIILIKSSFSIDDVIKIGFVYGVASVYMLFRYHSARINSLGVIAIFGITCIINCIDYYINQNKVIILTVLAVYTCIVISATEMRGAVLATIIVFVYSISKQLKTTKHKAVLLVMFPTVFIITYNIIKKYLMTYLFQDKYGHGHIVSGRDKIWTYILSNAGIFGLGPNYVANLGNGYVHAHNTLFHFIARYGYLIIPFIIPIVVEISKKIKKIEAGRQGRDAFIRILLTWAIFSFTETIDFVSVWLYGPQFILLLYASVLYRMYERKGEMT